MLFFSTDNPNFINQGSANDYQEVNASLGSDIVNFNGFTLFNFTDFEVKLKNLGGFEGFTPRYTVITRLRNTTNAFLNTSAILIVIVSKICLIILCFN
jgi:hypothetical protein